MKPALPSSLLKTPLPVTAGCGPKVIRIQATLWGPLAASCEPRSPPLSIWGSLKGSRASGRHSHAHKCPHPELLVRGPQLRGNLGNQRDLLRAVPIPWFCRVTCGCLWGTEGQHLCLWLGVGG